MKSFLIAASIALAGSSMISDDAFARSKRGAAAMAGMAGIAAMAPLALSAGTALIGSGGYVGDPIVTPYGSLPVSTYAVPVVPDVHTPAFAPVQLPGGFGLTGADAQRHDLGG
jgi:hypothetical protein